MLAAWLATVAWVCFAVSVIGQSIWALTDGRRPAMPHQLYDSMIVAIGTMILAPAVILLDIYMPDWLAPLAVGMLFLGLACAFMDLPLTRPDQRIYPVTPAWEAAARRSAQFSRLFVGGTGGIVLIATPESTTMCALGAIAAMNLRYLNIGCRDKRLNTLGRIWACLTIALPFIVWCASRDGGLLSQGLNISYADLSLQMYAPIPGSDPATTELLQGYICVMLLCHLLTMAVETICRNMAIADGIFVLLKFLRGGIALIVLLFLLPDAPTASALFVKCLLIAIEYAVFMAPSPDSSLVANAAQRQDAAKPA